MKYYTYRNYYTLKEIIKDSLDFVFYIITRPFYWINFYRWQLYQKKHKIEKILLIYWGAIGDILTSTTAVAGIRKKYPEAKITFIGNKTIKHIFGDIINKFIEYDKFKMKNLSHFFNIIKKVRNETYDLCINLVFSSDRASLITLLSKAKYKAGAGPRHWSLFYHLKSKPIYTITHQIKRFLNILEAVGITNDNIAPTIEIDNESKKFADNFWKLNKLKNERVIMIHPGAKEEYKRWPIENYKKLITGILEKYKCKIILGWGSYDKYIALNLKKEFHNKSVILSPKTEDIIKFAALVDKCDYFIGNCSAPMTVAVAVNTPSVIIMGPNNPVVWSPYGKIHRFLLPKFRCKKCIRPCKKNFLCQNTITVEDVLNNFFILVHHRDAETQKKN